MCEEWLFILIVKSEEINVFIKSIVFSNHRFHATQIKWVWEGPIHKKWYWEKMIFRKDLFQARQHSIVHQLSFQMKSFCSLSNWIKAKNESFRNASAAKLLIITSVDSWFRNLEFEKKIERKCVIESIYCIVKIKIKIKKTNFRVVITYASSGQR